MDSATPPSGAELIAELNDLLALDHDAIEAYSLAIGRVSRAEYREALAGFRGDHRRHVDELTQLIRARGGVPVQLPHIPTGFFKAAIQALGTLGDDRAVLMAWKTNEGQVRDKYRRYAGRVHDPATGAIVTRAADDEERHYAWGEQTLAQLGVREGTLTHTAQETVEKVQGRVADVVEGAVQAVSGVVDRLRSGGNK
ncbi:MAG TPA: ferritin-like domain-containing protein [Longimicrobium sp.]|nr:ferritin-like domain-containing protein [Longimicrobium sp.]